MSVVAVSIAHNRLVRYSEGGPIALPSPTELALSIVPWLWIIPLCWLLISFFIWKKAGKMQTDKRNEYLLSFTTSTFAIGLAIFAFYFLAGIIPFFIIGGRLTP